MTDNVESAHNSECQKVEHGKAFFNDACAHFDLPVIERQDTLTCAIVMTNEASNKMSEQERLLAAHYQN